MASQRRPSTTKRLTLAAVNCIAEDAFYVADVADVAASNLRKDLGALRVEKNQDIAELLLQLEAERNVRRMDTEALSSRVAVVEGRAVAGRNFAGRLRWLLTGR